MPYLQQYDSSVESDDILGLNLSYFTAFVLMGDICVYCAFIWQGNG